MKNFSSYVKMACLWLAFLFLCGCGKESEPVTSDTEVSEEQTEESSEAAKDYVLPEDYAWLTHFEDAGGETRLHNIFPSVQMIGNSLYYYYRTVNWEDGNSVVEGNAYLQEEGEEPQPLNLPEQDEMMLEAMTAGEDGSLYLLYKERTEEDQFPTYMLEKRDKELTTVYTVDTTAGLKEAAKSTDDPSYFDISFMAAGNDGRLYGLTFGTGMVTCWDETGVYQGCFFLPMNGKVPMGNEKLCFGLVNAGASGIYAYWGVREEEKLGPGLYLCDLKKWMEMDEADRKEEELLQVDFSSAPESISIGNGEMFVLGNYEDGLYLIDTDHLWQIDMTDGSVNPLLDWQDLTLKGEYVTAIRRQAEGGYLLYVFDTLEQENYWVRLEPVPTDTLPEKTELVLGVAGSLRSEESLLKRIDQVVLSYNRTHPYSHVTVQEYGNENITNFQMELLKGEGPDILMETENFFDMETLMAKGAVEDLAPYLTGGGEVSDQDILPGILELIKKDGRIPRIPLSFSVGIMILPKDRPQEIMTPAEAADFMAGSDGTYIDCGVWPAPFLVQMLTGAEMDHYVDAEGKSCSFDSEEFIDLLERLAKLSDMKMIMDQRERFEPVRSGQLAAVVDDLDSMGDYLCIRASFYDAWEIAGFPNSDRQLRYPATLYDWLGISSASEHKEEAWGFIEFCLAYTSRSDNAADRFVVTKEKFERQIRFEKGDPYQVMGNYFFDGSIDIFQPEPTTQEETDFLREISEHLYFYEDQNLEKIIREEADIFFAGDVSAEEAAKRIQNRVSLLLNE